MRQKRYNVVLVFEEHGTIFGFYLVMQSTFGVFC